MDPSTTRIKIERLREHYVRKYAEQCNELLKEHRAEYAAEASLLLQGSSTTMCTKAMNVQQADEIERTGFDSSPISELTPTLRSVFGHQHLYPVQEQAIKASMAGHDVLLVTATGGGKSLTYQLPAILRPGCTLVISPTISLVLDQLHIAQRLQIEAVGLASTTPVEEIRTIKARLRAMADHTLPKHVPPIKICYATPERVDVDESLKTILSALAQNNLLARIVIDEAHCVADMGHKFRASYSKLDKLRDLCPDVPVLCLTATCTRKSWSEISRVLKLGPICDVATPSRTLFLSAPLERPNLLYRVIPKPRLDKQLPEVMAHFILDNYLGQSGIIYCPTKAWAVTVRKGLARYSGGRIKASFFHSEVETGKKKQRYERWMRGDIHVMCATSAFGLGINKRDVRFVMHHTPTLEQYFQESGRAGRDNLPSACILYHKAQDAANAAALIKTGLSGVDDLRGMLRYAQDLVTCRQRLLAQYFLDAGVQTQAGARSSGQSLPDAECGRCDNCTRARGVVQQRSVAGDAWLILHVLHEIHAQGQKVTIKGLAELSRGMVRTNKVALVGMKRKRSGTDERLAIVDLRALGGAVSPCLNQEDCERLIVQLFVDGYLDGFLYTTTFKKIRNQYLYMKLGPLAERLMVRSSREDLTDIQIMQRYVVDAGRRRVRQRTTEVPISTGTAEESFDEVVSQDETEDEAIVMAMVIEDEDEDVMASFSWSDTLQAFTSCVPCLRPGTPAEDDNPHDPTRNRVRRARPDELESLLADADSTDTEAETLSLHSNPGEGRRRRKKRRARNITLCGVDLFGKRRQAIQLPEDDGALFDPRRSSTTTSATFDSDAASLDPSDLTHISPAELERRALEEEERRQKEERRKRRRERREMRRVAEAIAAGELHDGDVPGYEGYVDTQPAPAARMSASRRLSVDAFGPFQQAPSQSPILPQDDADEADAADLDGGLYAGRRRAQGGSSVSGSRSGGSDSRSRTSASASQQDAQADLPPPPKQKRKKSKSGKASSSSKSSRSRASDTSASTTQSPSLVSPHAPSFTGALPLVYAISEHPASPTEGDFDGVVGMGLDSAPAQAYTSAELKPSAELKSGAGGLHVDVNGLTSAGALPSAALATGMPSPGLRTGMPSPGLGADMPSPGLPSPGLGGGPRRQSNARDMGAFLASK
ncbi:ATP-dependent DNA helicase [Schizophyllum commune H4-8]|uniref:ATP-dependent DNA helicase n=1 Tax=Schizophyllum commune (strain H4-8 / FGSC 9210) TaxID=578458 RepID=UPI00215E8096|nr:ATP-dependent DNA helicase [Schizophyllum commune H4-8]KAI5888524.1 ATP-dependent DNA helicase [Schizophyllum commune H4-8]